MSRQEEKAQKEAGQEDVHMKNKMIIFFVGSAILFFAALEARSDDKHHHTTQTAQIETSQAIAIATSQIHPELGSSKLQLGMGIGTHNDSTALAIGLHKRVDKLLIGGTFSSGNGETGIGFGVNMKF